MSVLFSLGIVVIAMLILAFLQLQPGIYALFQHYALGKHSKIRASYITTFYIIGTEVVTAGLFISALLVSNAFFWQSYRPETGFLAWVLAGIMVALAFISLTWYYRGGTGTKLFIPRKCAETLGVYARKADSRSDAFVLGALTSVLELPFTLPLYIIVAVALIELTTEFPPSLGLGLGVLIAPVLPLMAVRLQYRNGYNLADIQRKRVKDKTFVRFLLGFCYATLGALFIYFGIK